MTEPRQTDRRSSQWRTWITGEKFTFLLVALLVLVLAPLVWGTSTQRSPIFAVGSLLVLFFGVLAVARHGRALVVAVVLGVPAAIAPNKLDPQSSQNAFTLPPFGR